MSYTCRRRRVRSLSCELAAGALLGVSAPALAADETARGEPPPSSNVELDSGAGERPSPSAANGNALSFEGWLGFGQRHERGRDGWDLTGSLGLDGLYRMNALVLGASAELSSAIFDDHGQYFGGLVGLWTPATRWFDVTTLLEAGAHMEQPDTGLHIFGTSRITGGETSTTVPYVGLRLEPKFRVGRPGGTRFVIGPTLFARQDLVSTTQRYTVEQCGSGLFGGEYSCSTGEEESRVGGLQLSGAVTAGIEFGGRD